MSFLNIFGRILHLIAAIFKGRTGQIVEALGPLAKGIILELMTSDLPGAERFKVAFEKIKAAALAAGIKAADHAIALLIELEVTKAKGDPLEKILDEGLETARQVIIKVNQEDLAGDAERRAQACKYLADELLRQGKAWATSTSTINLLIEAAVASFKN